MPSAHGSEFGSGSESRSGARHGHGQFEAGIAVGRNANVPRFVWCHYPMCAGGCGVTVPCIFVDSMKGFDGPKTQNAGMSGCGWGEDRETECRRSGWV